MINKKNRTYDTGLEYFLWPKRSFLDGLAELAYFNFHNLALASSQFGVHWMNVNAGE